MFYNDYEDYMRKTLGYQSEYANSFNNLENNYNSDCCMNTISQNTNTTYNNSEIEKMYPEIYFIINPMVKKICSQNAMPVTKELVEQMTLEIYKNLEVEQTNTINVNIETRKNENNISKNKTVEKSIDTKTREDRYFGQNPTLRDLIRILILNNLLRPIRPYPSFGPGPGFPPPPPFQGGFQQQPYIRPNYPGGGFNPQIPREF